MLPNLSNIKAAAEILNLRFLNSKKEVNTLGYWLQLVNMENLKGVLLNTVYQARHQIFS